MTKQPKQNTSNIGKGLDWNWIPLEEPLEISISQGVGKVFIVYNFTQFKQRVDIEIQSLIQSTKEETLNNLKIKGAIGAFENSFNKRVDEELKTLLVNKANEENK